MIYSQVLSFSCEGKKQKRWELKSPLKEKEKGREKQKEHLLFLKQIFFYLKVIYVFNSKKLWNIFYSLSIIRKKSLVQPALLINWFLWGSLGGAVDWKICDLGQFAYFLLVSMSSSIQWLLWELNVKHLKEWLLLLDDNAFKW